MRKDGIGGVVEAMSEFGVIVFTPAEHVLGGHVGGELKELVGVEQWSNAGVDQMSSGRLAADQQSEVATLLQLHFVVFRGRSMSARGNVEHLLGRYLVSFPLRIGDRETNNLGSQMFHTQLKFVDMALQFFQLFRVRLDVQLGFQAGGIGLDSLHRISVLVRVEKTIRGVRDAFRGRSPGTRAGRAAGTRFTNARLDHGTIETGFFIFSGSAKLAANRNG